LLALIGMYVYATLAAGTKIFTKLYTLVCIDNLLDDDLTTMQKKAYHQDC